MTIPVFLLTGFLGAGKSTLLRALLRTPEFARTAVLVNEVGEVHKTRQTSENGKGGS